MVGQTLGSYRIVSEIGSGGMGVVYLAEHAVLGRKVAVKLLRADMPNEYVERFFTEAKAAATLHHPGLVDVFDFGHHADGRAFIVMEFLPGESLAERLEREPRLPVSLACVITRAVANALHVAHDQGIIHRDLKPGNIFLIPDTEAPLGIRTKVLDFGIAKLVRDREQRSIKTQSGAVIGTPRYMSPEQCKNARTVDGRSDIYALGCILYEMLLGVAPFDYDSWAELVGAHLYEVPPRPTEIDVKIPPDIEALVTKMIEKAPDERFQSMQELAQAIEGVLATHGGETVRLTPPSLRVAATPPRGVKKFDSGDDPTMLPSQSGQTAAVRPSTTGETATVRPPTTGEKPGDAVPTPRGDIVTDAVRPARGVPWIAIAIAAVGVVALAVALIVFKQERKAESESPVIVVDKRREGSATPVEDPPVAIDAAAPEAAGSATALTPGKPPKVPTTTDLDALTRTFGKQSPAITACFKKHPGATEQVSVRIQIDVHGAVKAAEVLPASVGATPLGACIADITRKTTFGPQPKPVTFRVPLVKSER